MKLNKSPHRSQLPPKRIGTVWYDYSFCNRFSATEPLMSVTIVRPIGFASKRRCWSSWVCRTCFIDEAVSSSIVKSLMRCRPVLPNKSSSSSICRAYLTTNGQQPLTKCLLLFFLERNVTSLYYCKRQLETWFFQNCEHDTLSFLR